MCDNQKNLIPDILIRTALAITSAALTANALPINQIETVARELQFLRSHLEDEIIDEMAKVHRLNNKIFLESWPETNKIDSIRHKLISSESPDKLLKKIGKLLKKHAFSLDKLRNYRLQSEYVDDFILMSRREKILARLAKFLRLAIEECEDAMWPESIRVGSHKSVVKLPLSGGLMHMLDADRNFINSLKHFLMTAVAQLEQVEQRL